MGAFRNPFTVFMQISTKVRYLWEKMKHLKKQEFTEAFTISEKYMNSSTSEILEFIKKIKIEKAPGPDKMTYSYYKC